jgi:hypothetical protein
MGHQFLIDGESGRTQGLSDNLATVETAPWILGAGPDEDIRTVWSKGKHNAKTYCINCTSPYNGVHGSQKRSKTTYE